MITQSREIEADIAAEEVEVEQLENGFHPTDALKKFDRGFPPGPYGLTALHYDWTPHLCDRVYYHT
jgi:hypothetical protein